MHALILNGVVWQLFASDPMLGPGHDVRDVSGVPGIAEGWTAAPDGTFLAPVVGGAISVDLVAYAAAKRYAVETGGVVVNGAKIATDRGSQAMIVGAYAYVGASGAASIRFKASSGWTTLTAEQVKALALAVGTHVQAAFAVEDDLDAAINASPPTVTTTAQIDAAPWPANS